MFQPAYLQDKNVNHRGTNDSELFHVNKEVIAKIVFKSVYREKIKK